MKTDILSVSQVNRYLKDILDFDPLLKKIRIKGEISNFTNHKKTGHLYFTLKDAGSSIKVIMFNSYSKLLKFDLEDGMEIVGYGKLGVFERDGIFQLYCEDISVSGDGILYIAYEKLKDKLLKLGYFDNNNKKQLPTYPKNVGIITSGDGAALEDMINIISRRYPICKLTVISAIVQGSKAEDSLCDSLKYVANNLNVDVIIIGRGGGSAEDLWCFNSEKLAREIYDSNIPIVSAVGHETDYTISDFVADIRASTPSVAAELVTPNKKHLIEKMDEYLNILESLISDKIYKCESLISSIYTRMQYNSPVNITNIGLNRIDEFKKSLSYCYTNNYSKKVESFTNSISKLELLSPMKVIERGYSITYSEDNILKSVEDTSVGKEIRTKTIDGEVYSVVNKIDKRG